MAVYSSQWQLDCIVPSCSRYNHKMVVFTAVFLASSWYLTGPLGSAGFIMANCLNMLARIIHR